MSKRERDGDRDDRSYNRDYSKSRRTDNEPISTLHVSGFPGDTKTRELRNLGAFLPGFEGAVINRSKGESQIGFMKFVNPKAAMAAMGMLHGYQFDEPSDSRDGSGALRVSMAKRNMNVGRSSRGGQSMQGLYNPYMQAPGFSDYGMEAHMPYYGGSGYDMAIHAAATAAANATASHSQQHGASDGQPTHISAHSQGKPCNTICLQGITPWTTEADIGSLVRQLSGYKDMKMLGKKGLGFVRFESEDDAGAALQQLDGSSVVLPGSNPGTNVRIEYAKRPLTEKPPSRDRDDDREDRR